MNKRNLIQKHFKYDNIHDEYYYEREDIKGRDSGEGKIHWFGDRNERIIFKPNDQYRCEFLLNKKRVGKIHYDAIRFLYDSKEKPILEIFVQGGLRLTIAKNEVSFSQFESVKDNHYFHLIPSFDSINFYIKLNMELSLTELRETNRC